jgi:hypothetical protein
MTPFVGLCRDRDGYHAHAFSVAWNSWRKQQRLIRPCRIQGCDHGHATHLVDYSAATNGLVGDVPVCDHHAQAMRRADAQLPHPMWNPRPVFWSPDHGAQA